MVKKKLDTDDRMNDQINQKTRDDYIRLTDSFDLPSIALLDRNIAMA